MKYVTTTKTEVKTKHDSSSASGEPVMNYRYYPIATLHKYPFTYDFFNLEVCVTTNNFFRLQETKITPGFLSLKNKKDCLRLEKNPLSFYQNQFNMAVWF
ncbi:hypothetical protein, partial [Bartonella sp. CL29QHWL]|uniref:hypothetical protein n=1 Tax=Bartonella sp. CL29QHWL TaxID=3243522 RepID=UPI0035D08BE0